MLRWLMLSVLLLLPVDVRAQAQSLAQRCQIEASKAQAELPLEALEIASSNGVYPFEVEMVRTDAQRAAGLMFRCEIKPGRGMLFDFDNERDVAMWMRNTYVSLDMIFIRADGRISHIAENAEPLSERIIGSGGPARAVLEVAAGTARMLGLKAGDRVGHPLFRRH